MTLYQCLLEKNPCLLAGRALTPRGIVVHSTGANNPTLKRYVQPHAAQTQGMARLLPDPQGPDAAGAAFPAGRQYRRQRLEPANLSGGLRPRLCGQAFGRYGGRGADPALGRPMLGLRQRAQGEL